MNTINIICFQIIVHQSNSYNTDRIVSRPISATKSVCLHFWKKFILRLKKTEYSVKYLTWQGISIGKYVHYGLTYKTKSKIMKLPSWLFTKYSFSDTLFVLRCSYLYFVPCLFMLANTIQLLLWDILKFCFSSCYVNNSKARSLHKFHQ